MSKSASGLSVQVIVIAALAWALLSLLFFLIFSTPLPDQGRPEWYGITTYVLETAAFLGAGLLCLRNWKSPQIVSGRTVWLLIGAGMLSYFVGNLLLGQWEIGWGQTPNVSPADLFYLLMYVLVGIGMVMAIAARQLNLAPVQWLILLAIAVAGAAIAYVIYNSGGGTEAALFSQPAYAQTAAAPEAAAPPEVPTADPVAEPAPAAEPTPTPSVTTPPEVTPPEAEVTDTGSTAPAWVISLDEALVPYADWVGLFYVVADVLLLLAASALLLAFWGGRFSQSWRFIAAASICFFIADMWFLYATSNIADYQTGALPEVFWIFSACLFGIGAALEYDLSSRSRRMSRRRS
ncbi:hypothetical protein ACQ4M4_22310 [Leptolyngbya sp. AN02str]|uniref:hypothetical protein n=1 Tax=Leptolyngbya sp. AN02str TaxID=3423363 RepID=UPI003D30FC8C